MSFRRHLDHKRRATEKAWIERHWKALKEIGLPPIVICDYDHWADFLVNGYLDHHEDTTGFHFSQLSNDQMRKLRSFLEEKYRGRTGPFLLGYLRVRLGLCSACGHDLRGNKECCPACGAVVGWSGHAG